MAPFIKVVESSFKCKEVQIHTRFRIKFGHECVIGINELLCQYYHTIQYFFLLAASLSVVYY